MLVQSGDLFTEYILFILINKDNDLVIQWSAYIMRPVNIKFNMSP